MNHGPAGTIMKTAHRLYRMVRGYFMRSFYIERIHLKRIHFCSYGFLRSFMQEIENRMGEKILIGLGKLLGGYF